MSKKFDYVIIDDKWSRVIFRFYPKRSHVHSFNEEPPKDWNEVYKTYFTYSILRQEKREDGTIHNTIALYDETFDECSCVDGVAEIARQIFRRENEHKEYTLLPAGYGTVYYFERIGRKLKNNKWEIRMFSFPSNKGFRFTIDSDGMNDLAKTIESFLSYMIKHGEPI